jgi:hypothetical protein
VLFILLLSIVTSFLSLDHPNYLSYSHQNKNGIIIMKNGNEDALASAEETTDEDTQTSSTSGGDLSGEAAGVVRGVSRSIVRAPLIGRLPKAATRMPPVRVPKPPSAVGRGILRRRVPIRRVARVSDRVSTGWDWYTSALEVDDGDATSKTSKKTPTASTKRNTQWMLRARSFSWNLMKNTLLGMAVFEGYGYVVSSLAPPAPTIISMDSDENNHNIILVEIEHSQEEEPSPPYLEYSDHDADDDDDESSSSMLPLGEPDEYSRASLPVHFFAGSTAGIVHGLVSTVMEGNPTSRSLLRYTTLNTLHHGMAHAMLFGSYESIKRGILKWTDDEDRSYHGGRAYHLITFALAGGLAGQVQHLASHYAEEAFGLSSSQSLQIDWRSALRSTPALRPALRAFPPSAIGFIAFEYGKEFTSSSS